MSEQSQLILNDRSIYLPLYYRTLRAEANIAAFIYCRGSVPSNDELTSCIGIRALGRNKQRDRAATTLFRGPLTAG